MSVPPLADLKLAAANVLRRALRPMYYADVTRDAVADLGLEIDDGDMRLAAADLREKAMQAGAFGMGYLGRPYCLAYLKEWFAPRVLLNVDAVRLDVTTTLASRAGAETALRYAYVLNKYGSRPREHAERIARGFVIEQAVAAWFRREWPSLYRPPENEGRYAQPCGHDFRLALPSLGLMTVDVAGPHRDGLYGASPGKPRADVHVVAADEGLTVVITGIVGHGAFRRGPFAAEEAQSITRLRVLLNCEGAEYSYFDVAAELRRRAMVAV